MEDSERRKAIELLKEMRSDNKTEDGKAGNQETRLNWMYKGPSDLIDREEYLLGKAIGKMFEVLNTDGNSDAIGRTGEQSNVPKRMLEKTGNTEQVDIAKKILEDPLYAIKQKEMEARKKLLNNPVKLKQIKQMLLERSRQNSSHKKKKKKSKKKSEQDLNLLIIKKLRKFTDKEKSKALSKIMQSDSESSSVESSSSGDKKYTKKKSKKKRSYSSSDESDVSSESSSPEEKKKTKSEIKNYKSEVSRRKQNKKSRYSDSESDSSDGEWKKKSGSKKSTNKKLFKKPLNSSSSSESSLEANHKKKFREGNQTNSKNIKIGYKKNELKEQRRDERTKRENKDKRKELGKRENFSERERKLGKSYGLMMPDGSKPEMKKRVSPIKTYEKHIDTKTKYNPPTKIKPLSEREKEKKLKEMMEDAKLRKADREKNLANHRKKVAEEEEPKAYDDDFMRRQMSHLTSQGTMADRIKSNINNIQRSGSSMETSFMRK